MNEDCIFCKLANGEYDTYTLYEDEDFRVILDGSPAVKGHALVIPKKHYKDAIDADEDILGKAMVIAARTGNALKKALNCDGINIVQNNGLAAGQTVFHLHIHVIPRYNNDKSIVTWIPGNDTEENYKKIVELVKPCYEKIDI